MSAGHTGGLHLPQGSVPQGPPGRCAGDRGTQRALRSPDPTTWASAREQTPLQTSMAGGKARAGWWSPCPLGVGRAGSSEVRGRVRAGWGARSVERGVLGLGQRAAQTRPGRADAAAPLFPLRNSGRISTSPRNSASKLCCEQFGDSRRGSGSLAAGCSAPHPRLLFVWTWRSKQG